MTRIIKHGNYNPDKIKEELFKEKVTTCIHCKCEFEYSLLETTKYGIDTFIECPECKSSLVIE